MARLLYEGSSEVRIRKTGPNGMLNFNTRKR